MQFLAAWIVNLDTFTIGTIPVIGDIPSSVIYLGSVIQVAEPLFRRISRTLRVALEAFWRSNKRLRNILEWKCKYAYYIHIDECRPSIKSDKYFLIDKVFKRLY